ncbi:MAG: GH3 auxin-responsive promoter family protein, partial [Muribaculaceae bacterium]|nr:GH3 auxin-responsive promoter family protein [Muribaculaceae bacterium]
MIDFTGISRPYFERVYAAELRAEEHLEAGQRRLLGNLVASACHTHIGSRLGFGNIKSYEDFAGCVPVGDYASLRPDVMRMVEGESGVLWPGAVRRFAQSSGTSDGKSKFIPITPRCLSRGHYAGAAFSLASYLHHHPDSHVFGGKNFILGGSYANELQLPKGVRVGDLSATLIDRINPLVNLFRIPAKQVALMENWQQKLPALVEASMKADVRSISGVPSWFLT